jgi:hypothetical protein
MVRDVCRLLARDGGPGRAGVIRDEDVRRARSLDADEDARRARGRFRASSVEHNPADAEWVAVVACGNSERVSAARTRWCIVTYRSCPRGSQSMTQSR